MSGHSKWAQIKRQKAVTDGKRGKMFTKLIRGIVTTARLGGTNPDSNASLRLAIDRALAANMPKDNIDRALAKAEASHTSGAAITLEAYGPGGVALLLEVMTDNRNRTIAEIRHALESHHGSLGSTGSVAWQFEHVGKIVLDAKDTSEENELKAIDAGATDVQKHDEVLHIITQPTELKAVEEKLKQMGFTITISELTFIPKQKVAGSAELEELVKLLEEHEDILEVVSNAA